MGRPRQPTHRAEAEAYGNLYVLTVVCRADGLISRRLNASVVQVMVDGLSATIPAGVHAVLVWDGAGYHVAKALRMPANLTILGLPPYSPELNLVERLWLDLRQHHWSNRLYEDVVAVEEAAMAGWRVV
ncbi:transposase [Isosphaeraceae bacterium EP7]